jgi:ribosomal protein S18 acetylase RimI-like enzyme
MVRQDLREVARLHRQHFPDGYYARLGEGFLVAHYRGYLDSPHAVAYVVASGGQVQAYLVGTVDEVAHRLHQAQSRRLARAAAGITALGARPNLWGDFLAVRSHWYARRALSGLRRTSPADPNQRPFGELAYVITRSTARNQGIGAHLVGSYLTAARTAGGSHAFLVTLVDNGVARHFYQKRGWVPDGMRRSRDGAVLAAYRYDL